MADNMIKLLHQYDFAEDTMHKFLLHKNHLIINKYYSRQGGGLSSSLKALDFVKNNYQNLLDTMSNSFKFKLAKCYVFANKYQWAMYLLKPLAESPNYK